MQDAKVEIQILTDEKVAEAAKARQEIEEAHEKELQAAQEAERVQVELEAREKVLEEERRLREAVEAEKAAYKALPWYKKTFR